MEGHRYSNPKAPALKGEEREGGEAPTLKGVERKKENI